MYHKKGKPTILKPKPKPKPKQEKPKGFWQKLKDAFSNNHDEEKPDIPSVYDETEDFDTELEEDLICKEEWF